MLTKLTRTKKEQRRGDSPSELTVIDDNDNAGDRKRTCNSILVVGLLRGKYENNAVAVGVYWSLGQSLLRDW